MNRLQVGFKPLKSRVHVLCAARGSTEDEIILIENGFQGISNSHMVLYVSSAAQRLGSGDVVKPFGRFCLFHTKVTGDVL